MNCKSSYGLYLEWYFKTYMGVKVTQSCPTLCVLMDSTIHEILCTRVLEWVAFPFSSDLPNPGIELRSPILWADSLPAEPPGKPRNTGVVAYPFSSGSSWPRNQTGVSCIAGRFFTNWAIREALKASIFTAFLNPQFLKQCMASRQTW